MRSTLLAPALLATLALSKPIAKREYETIVDVVTVFTTVTEGSQVAPATAHPNPVSTVVVTVSPPAATPQAGQGAQQQAGQGSSGSTAGSNSGAQSGSNSGTTSGSNAGSSSGSAATSNTGNTYQDTVINQHNLHRANNSASALQWDNNLASIAQQIASSCVYAHNTAAGGGGYGQNIGAGTLPADVGKMITNEMYNGEINSYPTPYGNDNPSMSDFETWGHYSQIVWQATTHVGCATQYCPGGLANTGSDVPPYFTVCNYSPPGNFAGQYSNVGEPLGKASVTV